MIDFFRFGQHPSHYEQAAPGPTIQVQRALTSNEKIVLACQDLETLNKRLQEYIPAPELTEVQRALLDEMNEEKERRKELFDAGLWIPSRSKSSFKIKEIG